MNEQAFWEGFCAKSVALGVDPRALVKSAMDLSKPRGAPAQPPPLSWRERLKASLQEGGQSAWGQLSPLLQRLQRSFSMGTVKPQAPPLWAFAQGMERWRADPANWGTQPPLPSGFGAHATGQYRGMTPEGTPLPPREFSTNPSADPAERARIQAQLARNYAANEAANPGATERGYARPEVARDASGISHASREANAPTAENPIFTREEAEVRGFERQRAAQEAAKNKPYVPPGDPNTRGMRSHGAQVEDAMSPSAQRRRASSLQMHPEIR
jgi:hypothetical protein